MTPGEGIATSLPRRAGLLIFALVVVGPLTLLLLRALAEVAGDPDLLWLAIPTGRRPAWPKRCDWRCHITSRYASNDGFCGK